MAASEPWGTCFQSATTLGIYTRGQETGLGQTKSIQERSDETILGSYSFLETIEDSGVAGLPLSLLGLDELLQRTWKDLQTGSCLTPEASSSSWTRRPYQLHRASETSIRTVHSDVAVPLTHDVAIPFT